MSEEAAHAVAIEETTAPVEAGEPVEVTVAVENTGKAGTDTVELLDFDGEQVDAADEVDLDAGGATTVELSWTPSGESVGVGEITVQSSADTATARLTVEDAPAAFAVEIASADEFVPAGGVATVTVAVENTGTLEGSEALEIAVDEDHAEARTLTLGGGERDTVEFTQQLDEDDAPEVTIAAESDEDSAETTVSVVSPTVTPVRAIRSKSGMGVFGWLMILGMAILLLPLLPFLAVLKLLDMLFGDEPIR
jgi:hypothetical protein